MFFESVDEIEKIAAKTAAAIFVLPKNELLKIHETLSNVKMLFWLEPKEKKTISVEETRGFLALTNSRQKSDMYLAILPADAMTVEAENAFLKNLEEPGEHYHFLLFTTDASLLLPTIRSRAGIYFLRKENPLDAQVVASDEIKELARELIQIASKASTRDGIKSLTAYAAKVSVKKDDTRARVLEIVSVAIEIIYKSYFKTGTEAFLKILPKFLTLEENLRGNGHIKLHIVADLC